MESKDEGKSLMLNGIIDGDTFQSPLQKKYRLCIKEDYYVIVNSHVVTLNKRGEFVIHVGID